MERQCFYQDVWCVIVTNQDLSKSKTQVWVIKQISNQNQIPILDNIFLNGTYAVIKYKMNDLNNK